MLGSIFLTGQVLSLQVVKSQSHCCVHLAEFRLGNCRRVKRWKQFILLIMRNQKYIVIFLVAICANRSPESYTSVRICALHKVDDVLLLRDRIIKVNGPPDSPRPVLSPIPAWPCHRPRQGKSDAMLERMNLGGHSAKVPSGKSSLERTSLLKRRFDQRRPPFSSSSSCSFMSSLPYSLGCGEDHQHEECSYNEGEVPIETGEGDIVETQAPQYCQSVEGCRRWKARKDVYDVRLRLWRWIIRLYRGTWATGRARCS